MNEVTALARRTIENYLKNRALPEDIPAELKNKRAGCFVSLHFKKDGKLRGCIGTIEPVCKNLGAEIKNNAVSVCHDPRFLPLELKELPGLEVEVDVLSPPEPISSPSSLDPQKYGVIVKSSDGRTGVLLPGIEDIKTVEIQLDIARQKAGLSPREPVSLFRFTVRRYKED